MQTVTKKRSSLSNRIRQNRIQTKIVTKDKEKHFVMIKGLIPMRNT